MDPSDIINIFLNKRVPENIANLFVGDFPATTPITLTPRDTPYLHYTALFGTPAEPVEMIRISARIPADAAEINFLDTLGLIAVRDGTTYISPLAEALYGPTGPFQVDTTDMTPAGRRKVYTPTAGLFSKYVIPGYMARANQYHAMLPDTIGLATEMDQAQLVLATISARLEEIVSAGPLIGKPTSKLAAAAQGVASAIQATPGAIRDFVRPPQ
jgi:hypothetical protein